MTQKDEITLIIDGPRPQRIPLARLADYMAEFAKMLGDSDAVYFSEIREGSTCIAAHAAPGRTLTSAARRVEDASTGRAPQDSMRAHSRIREMACTDKRSARITRRSNVILRFPTAMPPEPVELSVSDRGHVTGHLYGMFSDGDKDVRLRVRPMGGGAYVQCTADVALAEKMAAHFRKVVRIYGSGWWHRNADGWACRSMVIDDFEPVVTASIAEAFREIRQIDAGWEEDFFDDLEDDDREVGFA